MKKGLTFLLFLMTFFSHSQESIITWTPNVNLELSDFQSLGSTLSSSNNHYSIQSGIVIDFAFHMSRIEFMFTKHFNQKVACTFNKKSSVLIAPDTIVAKRLLLLAKYDFDLSELYARKIRKELYDNKKTFSNASFFRPIFNKLIEERNEISARIFQESNFGVKAETLKLEHNKVKSELNKLADFCYTCTPSKKKKKRKAK